MNCVALPGRYRTSQLPIAFAIAEDESRLPGGSRAIQSAAFTRIASAMANRHRSRKPVRRGRGFNMHLQKNPSVDKRDRDAQAAQTSARAGWLATSPLPANDERVPRGLSEPIKAEHVTSALARGSRRVRHIVRSASTPGRQEFASRPRLAHTSTVRRSEKSWVDGKTTATNCADTASRDGWNEAAPDPERTSPNNCPQTVYIV
jgi:hypothetical protein